MSKTIPLVIAVFVGIEASQGALANVKCSAKSIDLGACACENVNTGSYDVCQNGITCTDCRDLFCPWGLKKVWVLNC